MTDYSSTAMKFSSAKSPRDTSDLENWKILIVDDESIMHSVTELVLRDYKFEGRKLRFLSAYSVNEAQEILSQHNDIAVAFVDIVMEEDNSGLKLIQWVREELENSEIRIILRTGQPGLAPERDIIQRYEINDYKEKTELTDVKLITSLTVAIRGYRDIHVLNRNKNGFETILRSGRDMWMLESSRDFLSLINNQFLQIACGDYLCGEDPDALMIQKSGMECKVIKASGSFSRYNGQSLSDETDSLLKSLYEFSQEVKTFQYREPYLFGSLATRQAVELFLIVKTEKAPDYTDSDILSAFLLNSSLAMDYWFLTSNRSRSQKKMLFFLSEVIEQHFSETGNHIQRVSEMVHLMAVSFGYSEDEAEHLKMASILHDIGKIGIPDKILKKPGKLNDNEMEIMKSHVQIGHRMLSSNEDEFFPDAAEIALSHHECWDGHGYPEGLKGEDIPLSARILAVVDVFDALTHLRVYKDAWSEEDALKLLQDKKNIDFDPSLVDLFIDNFEKMKDILSAHPD